MIIRLAERVRRLEAAAPFRKRVTVFGYDEADLERKLEERRASGEIRDDAHVVAICWLPALQAPCTSRAD